MKKQTNINELHQVLKQLDELLTERIQENNTIGKAQGLMTVQHTHTFRYYRDKVWEAQRLLNSL